MGPCLAVVSMVVSCGVVSAQAPSGLADAANQIVESLVASAATVNGEVAAVDGDTLYVALGSEKGVLKGQLLDIRSKGEPIEVGGEVIGHKEKTVGIAEITFVQNEKLSEAKILSMEPGETAAKGMNAYVRTVPSRLAVASFDQTGGSVSQMGQEFADGLATALQATGKFTMLERSRLEAVLAEQGLALNDLFDPAKAAELGNLVTAEAIVMGSVTQQDASYTINARVVDIATGIQVATAQAMCGRGEELDEKFATAVGRAERTRPRSTTGGGIPGSGPAGPAATTLFKDVQPDEVSETWQMRPLEKCSIGGKLYKRECVGHRFQAPGMVGMGPGGAARRTVYAIFDIADGGYRELVVRCGANDTNEAYQYGELTVRCDGDVAAQMKFAPLDEAGGGMMPGGLFVGGGGPVKGLQEISVPLKDVGTLRLDLSWDGGVVVVGGFQLVK